MYVTRLKVNCHLESISKKNDLAGKFKFNISICSLSHSQRKTLQKRLFWHTCILRALTLQNQPMPFAILVSCNEWKEWKILYQFSCLFGHKYNKLVYHYVLITYIHFYIYLESSILIYSEKLCQRKIYTKYFCMF